VVLSIVLIDTCRLPLALEHDLWLMNLLYCEEADRLSERIDSFIRIQSLSIVLKFFLLIPSILIGLIAFESCELDLRSALMSISQ
tara:strand:+ start:173 stop:427 length:255 start_codon:yes stop_codon:yes gene_type:complete